MMRAHHWYVISIDRSCWLDDKGVPSGCHQIDDKGLTPASYCYAKVVARWLEVLASYAGRLNLMVITSGIILEQLRAQEFTLSSR